MAFHKKRGHTVVNYNYGLSNSFALAVVEFLYKNNIRQGLYTFNGISQKSYNAGVNFNYGISNNPSGGVELLYQIT